MVDVVFDNPAYSATRCVFANPLLFLEELGGLLGSGGQFEDYFKPVLIPISEMMRIDTKQLASGLEIGDTEIEIDDKSYRLVAKTTPSEIIRSHSDVAENINKIVERIRVKPRQVKRALFDNVIKELKKVETVKESVFNDDEEIIMVLVATDDI